MQWLLGILLVFVASSCSSVQTTSLRLITPEKFPAHARVIIDDEDLGSLTHVKHRGVALPAGIHRISIEASGYLPFDAEVTASANGGRVQIQVQLVKIPD